MANSIKINPKSQESEYVAIDVNNGATIIAEGNSLIDVVTEAEQTGKDFSLMYVTKEGQTYIY